MVDESDNEDRRGWKNNTGREHKPKDSKNYENAPTGHLGFEVVFTPSPSLGKAIAKARSTSAGKTTQSRNTPEKTDNRPLAMKTGDREVDAHYGKDHRLVGEKELAELKSQNKSVEQEKSSSNEKKKSAQDIFNKFAKDKEQDRGLG